MTNMTDKYLGLQIIALVAASSIAVGSASAQNYAVTNLSSGGSYSNPTAINDAGQVTGYAYTSSGTQHALLYYGMTAPRC